jgi:hypothetical protein
MQILSSYKPTGNNQTNNVNIIGMTHKSDDTVPPPAPSSDPVLLETRGMVAESNTNNANAIPAFRIESMDVSSRNGRAGGDFVCGDEDYLYRRPFATAPWSSPTLTDTLLCECYPTETSAVLLFNTALALHQRGILVGAGGGMHHHLTNAASIYNMILTMIAPAGTSSIPAIIYADTATSIAAWWTRRHPSLAVLLMAVSNNLTHIYLEQLDHALMCGSRALLRNILQQITQTLQAKQEEAKAQQSQQSQQQMSNVNTIIHLEDFAFFHLNLFCLEREHFLISPAA